MGVNNFSNGGEEEREAAADRIRRIREGQSDVGLPSSAEDSDYDDVNDAVARARARVRSTRDTLRGEDVAEDPISRARVQPSSRSSRVAAPADRTRQAMMIVGGLVVLGVLIVIIMLVFSSFTGGGGIPLINPPTATLTPTLTPTVTLTPTPAPTATVAAPNLALPPLTCVFQSGTGCFDYCQDAANADECASARSFISAQQADPDVFFSCLAPSSGPNQGNPQDCLEEAWRANQ